jgi:hypothetical protein
MLPRTRQSRHVANGCATPCLQLTLPLLLESIQDHVAHGRFPPVVSGEAATAVITSGGAGTGDDDE